MVLLFQIDPKVAFPRRAHPKVSDIQKTLSLNEPCARLRYLVYTLSHQILYSLAL